MIRKTIFLSFIYIMLSTNVLYAYLVSSNAIGNDAIFVQVGAFKNSSAVEKIRKKLKPFALIVQKNGSIVRIFAVASRKDISESAFLKKIRKKIPDAFLKRGFKPRQNFTSKSFETGIDLTNTLNSETILRTRKKFF